MSTEKTTTPSTVSTATIIKMGSKKKNEKPKKPVLKPVEA